MDDLRYYVYNGEMCSGTEICQMSISFSSMNPFDCAALCKLVFDNEFVQNQIPSNGTYVLMTGMRVVRLEDLSTTKEEAAEKFRQKLLES